MSTSRCEFCGLTDHAALVQCVHNGCNLWFCNGNTEKKINRDSKSHIMEHLNMLVHRKISVAKLGLLKCCECETTNIFELRLYENSDPNSAFGIICCSCALSVGGPVPAHRPPVVDPHDESQLAQCINRRIALVKLKAEGAKEVNSSDINRESDKISEKFGIRSLQNASVGQSPKLEFASVREYYEHFSQLEHLQSSKNAVQALLQSRMENITMYLPSDVFVYNADVADMIFATDSKINSKALKNGTLVSLFVERHGGVPTYQAYVKGISADEPKGKWMKRCASKPDCETGHQSPAATGCNLVFVSISSSFRNNEIRREFLNGTVSVEVSSDNVALERRIRAGKQFVSGNCQTPCDLKQQILNFPIRSRNRPKPVKFNLTPANLDPEEIEHVKLILSSPLCLITGPAGAGKTTLAIKAEKAQRSTGKGLLPSLYCANNNVAVGHLALKLKATFPEDEVTRITSESYASEDDPKELKELNLEYKFQNDLHKDGNQTQDQIERNILERSVFVCCTCSMAGSSLLKDMIFGMVVIDEATQASELETLIPIMKGSKNVNVVLLGDTKQLGVSTHYEMKSTGLSVSMFERLLQRNSVPTCTLTKQYRMNPSLWGPVAKVFYGIDVKNDENQVSDRKSVLKRQSETDVHAEDLDAIGIQVDSSDDIAADGYSSVNGEEAVVVTNIVLALLRLDGITAKDIGVISPYAGQTTLIGQLLRKYNNSSLDLKDLAIKTVDGFQGQQRRIIILSPVRSGKLDGRNGDLGFLADKRRINVAVSRQTTNLVIVGNLKYLRVHKTWNMLLSSYPTISCTDAMKAVNAYQQLGCTLVQSCLVPNNQTSQLNNQTEPGRRLSSPDVRTGLTFHNVQDPSPILLTTTSEEDASGVCHESTDPNTENLIKPKKRLYAAACKLILTYPQLESSGYPLLFRKPSNLNKDGSDGHVYMAYSHRIQEYQITHATRKCDRCSKNYDVGPDGIYLKNEACSAPEHPGYKKYDFNRKEVIYSCCGRKVIGRKNHCRSNVPYAGHISKSHHGMSKFLSTHTVELSERAMKWDFMVLALDCEMVFTTQGFELARVSIENSTETVYDEYVKVEGDVLDYKEPFSGIKEEDIKGPGARTLSEVHAELLGPIIHKDTILVGHSLQYDLLALRLVHTLVVDTAIVFMEGTYTPGLLEVARKHLNRDLQRGNEGHNSVADARACMDLVKTKVVNLKQI